MSNPKSPEQRFADLIRRKPTPVTTLSEFRSNTIQDRFAARLAAIAKEKAAAQPKPEARKGRKTT